MFFNLSINFHFLDLESYLLPRAGAFVGQLPRLGKNNHTEEASS